MEKPRSQVFFTSHINSESLLRIYTALNFQPVHKVAIKIHSGEPGGHYFLKPSVISPLIEKVNGTIIDANTPYEGHRSFTSDHYVSMKMHGFCDIAECDIIDEDGSINLSIPNGKIIKSNFVGAHLLNYKSIIILNHFKGHKTAGFGGVIKDISIGLASKEGKCWIHTAGQSVNNVNLPTPQDLFLESMVDAAKSVQALNIPIVYISFLNNISADGDGSPNPSEPEIPDLGIAASIDPVALDQSCLDMVREKINLEGNPNCKLINRINALHGEHVISAAVSQGIGCNSYDIVNID